MVNCTKEEKRNDRKRTEASILIAAAVMICAVFTGTVTKTEAKSKSNIKIAIDAGHQARGNFSTEPIGPGASTRKAKVAGGATGTATRIPEYKLTLRVAKKLQKELTQRGYQVYMIRTKNNVNIISYASDVQETGFINLRRITEVFQH